MKYSVIAVYLWNTSQAVPLQLKAKLQQAIFAQVQEQE